VPLIKLSLTFLFILFLTNSVYADQLTVTDGDTIRIGEERIRFSGIDAPELKQTCLYQEIEFNCGEFSKNLLIEKISNQEVNCIRESKDQYGRTLAECFVGKESLSSYLVREGYAFVYRQYSDKFIADEEFAKSRGNGMWSMEFLFPWDFRKKN
jgi:endonuclease YncB( thermonuclease family)|tara:strand:+ start:1471 stop:1932 length:462 start_codon:yes stop_codon:yes gene_type:complete